MGGQDHIAFSPAYAVDVTTHSQLASQSFAAAQTAEYIASRTGMLTNCGGDILGWWWTHGLFLADLVQALPSFLLAASVNRLVLPWTRSL